MSIASKINERGRSAIAQLGINLLAASNLYKGYWNHWRSDLFSKAEAKGLHILPVHYYTPIPTNAELNRQRRPNSLAGLNLGVSAGTEMAFDLISKYRADIDRMLLGSSGFRLGNSGFGPLDAAVLYAMIRDKKPNRIIEIGSGMSTIAMLAAIADEKLDTHLTCIEPYLPDYLAARRADVGKIIELPLQDVPLSEFESLSAEDILFIDSTHVVKFDSDVVYEFLEILPRVKPGVIIHVHDIFLPNDYPQKWLAEHRFFWTEQYLLQAFLCMNPNFAIDVPLHAASQEIHQRLADFPRTPVEVGSFWMRRV